MRIALSLLAAAALAVPACAQPSPTPRLDDAAIVGIFDLANTADIETGRLAMERGQSKDIRDFGRMLVDAHTAVRQQGRDLAKKLSVTPTSGAGEDMAKQHAATMQKLTSLRGAEFDRAFAAHEVAFHAAVLDAVKGTLLPAIQNGELKAFVTSIAPAFEAHRLGAENLRKHLGS
jgi:putative membrane protein